MQPLPPGALDLLVLETLRAGASHGYALATRIREKSEEVLRVEEGTLYPALHRMERSGWISSEWGRTPSGRRARFYSLTRQGRARLREQRSAWVERIDAMRRVLGLEPA